MLAARPLAARLILAASLALLCFAALASKALARDVYVANFGADTVSVIDSATNQVTATIPTGPLSGPAGLAISPDGRTVYATAFKGDSVLAISTETKSVVGPPIPVGGGPIAIAISPDGKRAYVANFDDDSVTVIDLALAAPAGLPIPVGKHPNGVAITPDGSRAFVANKEGGTISAIETATNQVVGAPILTGADPFGLAVTPDGKQLYATLAGDAAVAIIDPAAAQVVVPSIPVGEEPSGVAISPDGKRAYVANVGGDSVSVIDTASNSAVAEIGGIETPELLAISPDGRKGYASEFGPDSVTAFSIPDHQALSPSISTGLGASQLAFVPNQPPVAALSTTAKSKRVRPGVPAEFTALGSADPDGTVARFGWRFGDGKSETATALAVRHVFARPGKYKVTLTLTDDEGCSDQLVFTGQTASCNGSDVAAVTKAIVVAYPSVRVKCPPRAQPAGCKIKLRIVSVRGNGKKRVKAQSGFVRVKLKAGKSKVVALKPRRAFARGLARSKRLLVEETRTIDGEKETRIRRLKVVG